MSEKNGQSDCDGVNRRTVLKRASAATGALAFPGAAMADDVVPTDRQIDTSDWVVTVDEVDDGFGPDSGNLNGTDIYVGPNKNAAVPNRNDPVIQNVDGRQISTQNWSVSYKATLYSTTIPDEVPTIGGDELEVKVSGSVGFGNASISLDICVDGACLSIAGFNVDIGETTLSVGTKGTIYGVPFTIDLTLTVDVRVDLFDRDAEMAFSGSGQVCLGRDICDRDGAGWEQIGCSLCTSFTYDIAALG